MADQERLDDLGDDFEPPKSNKTMLIVAVVGVVALAGAGGFIFMGGSGSASAQEVDPAIVKGPPILVAFDPYIVNLNEPGAGRYLKLTVEYEVAGDKAKEALVARTAPIRHKALSYLSGLNFSQTQGSESKTTIQARLLELSNEEFKKQDLIEGVFFTEFVIQ